jgi:hypothetical protein
VITRLLRSSPVVLLLAALLPAAAGAAERYRVEATVWIDGQQRGTPVIVVEEGRQARIEVADNNDGWRMSVLVETPRAEEQADPGGVWLTVGLDRNGPDGWEHLTDTLIGTPLGKPGRISVVAPDAPADAGPEQAELYVELIARRAESAAAD